jgi:SAM-dependent methyltransferase
MSDIKQTVRDTYSEIARRTAGGCDEGIVTRSNSAAIGYDGTDLQAVPDGSNMGLGCGNPLAIADVKPGETVLDLGSGGGFDCFLAANAVGPTGKVIGVDMTEEMIAAARANAEKGGYGNVEFRLGEIENLPIEDASVDVVISNCVINLVPDKRRAFAEAARVLKPGGRMHVSDLVLAQDPPEWLLEDDAALVNCVGGAIARDEYLALIGAAGFTSVTVDAEHDATTWLNGYLEGQDEGECECECSCCGATMHLPDGLVASLTITARKPELAGPRNP